MKFTEFDLRPELLEAVTKVGYTDATPIQELVLPQILRGKDVSGLAQTGTGKTAAFVLPLMDRILRLRAGEEGERAPKNWKKNSFVLVLVPTRELAVQVEEAVKSFGKDIGMRSCVIVGGAGYNDQRESLRQGVEFIVGTPGRLLDLYKSHDLDLNGVGAIVFDEADRMFDMGFKDDMKFILRRVPRDRQFLLFSATLNFEVLNTAYQFGAEPVEFNVSRDQATAEGVDHEILHVGQFEKPMYLLSVLRKFSPKQCIVFSNFKHNVKPIAKFLKDNGTEAIEMSSLLSQAQRNKVLETFKSGDKQILVATDVAARGLDVKGIDLVVNFDLPDDPEGYVHRIGRTGRAGGSGKAVGLVSDRDVEALVRVETYLKEKIKIGWLEEADLVKEFKPYMKDYVSEQSGTPRPRPGQRRPPPPRQTGHRSPPPPRREGPRPNPQTAAGSAPRRPAQPHHRPTRPQQAPKDALPNKSHGQTAEGAHSAVASQHRDRRLGRHGGVANAATGGVSHPNQKNHPQRGHSRQRQNTSSQNQSQAQRRPLRKENSSARPGVQAKTETVGKKIKSFFSKLFK